MLHTPTPLEGEQPVTHEDEVRADRTSPVGPSLPKIVYTPASPLRQPATLLAGILRDVWRSRELTWILFQRDLKAQFRQSFFGYLWLIVPPLANALVWYLLNSQRLLRIETDMPYPVFVLIGSTLWAAFSATVIAPSDTIFQNREVFVKLNVPVESFILAGSGRAVFNLLVTCAVLLPLLWIQDVQVNWTIIFFPLAALTFLTSAFAIGMCLAPIGALYSDFRNGVAPMLAVLMFTVPVVFPVPKEPGLMGTIMRLNPLTPALELSRDMLLSGDMRWLGGSIVWLFASLVVLFATFAGLRVAKPHIIARMGM